MTERQLVRLTKIDSIEPIKDADAIEQAKIGGWTVVVKKGEFKPRDQCLYFEIDSALPMDDDRFEFLAPRGTKEIDGRTYHVLKTAKLRGVYSQGLALPASDFTDELAVSVLAGDSDLAEELGVFKYEPPLPTNMDVVGGFPTHLGSKTDAERVQNLSEEFADLKSGDFTHWYATEKIDGTSLSVFMDADSGIHVCSRNWELAEGENLYWRAARDLIPHLEPTMAIRAEIFGEGIQGNPLGISGTRAAVFDVTHGVLTVPRSAWPEFEQVAPIYTDLVFPETVEEAIEQVNGIKSLVSPGRLAEGVVWWAEGYALERRNFKAISNKYLLKHDG